MNWFGVLACRFRRREIYWKFRYVISGGGLCSVCRRSFTFAASTIWNCSNTPSSLFPVSFHFLLNACLIQRDNTGIER